jgi:hypothetical protein
MSASLKRRLVAVEIAQYGSAKAAAFFREMDALSDEQLAHAIEVQFERLADSDPALSYLRDPSPEQLNAFLNDTPASNDPDALLIEREFKRRAAIDRKTTTP